MDNNVAGKMAVGDQITGNAKLDAGVVTVAALNPDTDNVKEFSMSEAVAISDGVTLTFTPKCNRSLTTVVALNPDDDNNDPEEVARYVSRYLRQARTTINNVCNGQFP